MRCGVDNGACGGKGVLEISQYFAFRVHRNCVEVSPAEKSMTHFGCEFK